VIKSTAFAPNGAIPVTFTCEDDDPSLYAPDKTLGDLGSGEEG
jgi:hypothetical protein